MGNITLTNTLTNGTTADADEVMENLNDIVDIVNGDIDNDNIASDAAIVGSKLDLAIPGAIGGTTPAAGAFTTLSATGTATFTTLSATGTATFKKTVQTVTAATDGATITFDLSLGNIHTVTLGGNRTLAVSNETAGQCFMIELKQDGTGSRTVTWFDTITWADGSAPTLTTTVAKTDTVGFRCTGTDTYLGYIIGQNI